MRIAIASSNGKDVDKHFGKAKEFLIYDLADGKRTFVAKRHASPLSTGDRSHPFDAPRFRAIVDLLKDCRRIYAVRIGDRPRKELLSRGIEFVDFEGPMEGITW